MGEKGLTAGEQLADELAHGMISNIPPTYDPLSMDTLKSLILPPGLVTDPSDPGRLINQTIGQRAVWDDMTQQWIDAKAGGEKGLTSIDVSILPKLNPANDFPAATSFDLLFRMEPPEKLPPGFVSDPSDPSRLFNHTKGQNGVWDDKAQQWIDAKTGQAISYDQ